MDKLTVIRTLYNAGEPPNSVRIEFVCPDDSETGCYHPQSLKGNLWTSSGEIGVSVYPCEGGYEWFNDDRSGIEPTFDAAIRHLPAMVTHPDHFEEYDLEGQAENVTDYAPNGTP
jgi:hypothetical protein